MRNLLLLSLLVIAGMYANFVTAGGEDQHDHNTVSSAVGEPVNASRATRTIHHILRLETISLRKTNINYLT